VYGIRLHVMNQADTFDLKNRRPRFQQEKVIREQLGLPAERESKKSS
jgi:hypothetical protein